MTNHTYFLRASLLTAMAAATALAQTSTAPLQENVSLTRPATPDKVPAGSTVAVSIIATPAQAALVSLYGYQFDLKFDAARLQAVDVTEGAPFKSTNVSDFIAGTIDNTAGVIHTTYDTLQGPAASVREMSVPLAVVRFKAIQTGDADVSMQFPVLVDQTGTRVVLNVQPVITIPVADATPPVVTPQVTGTMGSGGWYTSNVSVSWTVLDAESGITSPACPTTTITTDTAGQTVTCTAVNGAGLNTTGSVLIKRDATVPTAKPTLAGTLGSNGWYTSNVTLNWTVQAGLSGVPNAPCPAQTITADTAGTVYTCRATSGAGLTGSTDVTVKRDATTPTVTPVVSGTLGSNNWYTSGVAVTWKYVFGPSQSTGNLCAPANLTADTPGTTLSCSVTSGAGLTGSQAITLKRDATPPVITGLPAPGSCVIWPPNNKLVTVATVTAKDAGTTGSGLAAGSPQVTGASNEPPSGAAPDIVIQDGVVQVRADRAAPGAGRIYTITAVASDVAGNKTTATGQCTVPFSQGNN